MNLLSFMSNLFGELGLFDAKQVRKGKTKEYEYSINNDNVLKYLQLACYSDSSYKYFKTDILKHFNI